MAQKAGKPKAVKAWAVLGNDGRPGHSGRSDYLWIAWTRTAAVRLSDGDERIVRVLVTPLEPSK